MICYGDRTFCASPDCKNECGRQFTDEHKADANRLGLPVASAYFCGEPKFDVEIIDLKVTLPLD